MVDLSPKKNNNCLDIGQLSERISIQKRVDSPDGAGGVLAVSWIEVFKLWAGFSSSKSNVFVAGHLQELDKASFTVQYKKEIAEIPPRIHDKYRVVFNHRAYKITAINAIENSDYYLKIDVDGNSWEVV